MNTEIERLVWLVASMFVDKDDPPVMMFLEPGHPDSEFDQRHMAELWTEERSYAAFFTHADAVALCAWITLTYPDIKPVLWPYIPSCATCTSSTLTPRRHADQ